MEDINKEKFISIFNTLEDGLLMFDREKKLVLINKSAKDLLDINEKDVIGRFSTELSNHPTLKFLFYVLGEEIKEVQRKELKLDEGLILEISSFSISRPDDGKLVVIHNITREKRVEKLKNEFVSLSAHQLRTPLGIIKWALEMLSREEIQEKEKRAIIEKVQKATERMIRLVDDLLNVVKIEEGKYVLKISSVDFEKLVKDVISAYSTKIEEKNIKFQMILPKKLPRVKIDSEKVSLVIQNLLENAIIYTPAGGEITITLSYNKNQLKFCIKDTGIGIPSQEKKNIFQKFFRASNAIKAETKGNGIGLFLSKNIIEAHKGNIWFESQLRKGTSFYFTLPLKQ